MTVISIRSATRRDATDLVALVDIAGEGLPAYFWSAMVEVGQSPFEIGRNRALRNEGSFSWRNAHLAEVDGTVAGLLIGYVIEDPVDLSNLDEMHEIVRPLAELEAEAPGHWYVNVLAAYPEFRGMGIGSMLLARADEIGRDNGTAMAIIVASENTGAKRLYERAGYRARASRPLRGFPGYKRGGDWVLMTKPHS
jgi:ribosomal protein S18 acetylase RimI-like enzyme